MINFKDIITKILKISVLALIGICIILLWQKIKTGKIDVSDNTSTENQIIEDLTSGEVGEIKQTEISEGVEVAGLPSAIFNTTGTVAEIKTDRLIVQGSGSNFTDQKARELTLIFTDETIVFEFGQKAQYQGFDGFQHLKTGESINISSPENIRGKTQFKVDYINKL